MGQGRITALEKPDGGIRGIVVGEIFRRVAARTIAQQYAAKAEVATAPHQYALKTKAGCETVAHILQVLTELDEKATVVSVDGIGAFDLISRNSMMRGLQDMVDGEKILPFVRAFYGQTVILLVGGRRWRCPRHPAGRGRGAGRSIDAHVVLFGTACSFGISEERVARGRTVVCIPQRSVCRLQAGEGCRSSQIPHLTPRRKDEGVEQEWRGARRLSRSSRCSSAGHSRSCRVERRQEFADLPAGVQGPRHSVRPPGFPQQFLEREDRESPRPFLIASQQFQTCSLRGFCCPIAPQHVQISS